MKFRLYKLISQFITKKNKILVKTNSVDNIIKKRNLIKSNSKEKNNVIDLENNQQSCKKTLVEKPPKSVLKIISSPKQQLEDDEYIDENEQEEINIIHKNKEIKFISIDLLIFMIGNEVFDQNFVKIFIEQSFAFISYERLINKIIFALKYFEGNEQNLINALTTISEFLDSTKKYNHKIFRVEHKIIEKMNLIIEKNNTHKKKEKVNNEEEENINSDKILFTFNILKYDSKLIAQVLTDITSENLLLLNEHKYELNPIFLSKDINTKKNITPNLYKIAQFSNQLTLFIIEDILSYNFPEKRALLFKKYIDVANELFKMKNYNDLLPVLCSFQNFAILNLKQTLNYVDKKTLKKKEELFQFISITNNYMNLRKEMENCLKNKINYCPFLGVFTRDIVYFENCQKYIKKGLINIETIKFINKTISDFSSSCSLIKKPDKNLYKTNINYSELKFFFSNLSPKNDDYLSELSQKLEPKFLLFAKIKNKRETKTESLIKINNNSLNKNK